MTYKLVFDVESVGLFGEGFAVGWVVVNSSGLEVESGFMSTNHMSAVGLEGDINWIEENVVPALPKPLLDTPLTLRSKFWEVWMKWKEKGAELWADCCWPVEANFLTQCVLDNPDERTWNGPYPLLDIASLLYLTGDPIKAFERLPNELPTHHPTNDARQSARILIATLNEIAGTNND